MKTAFVIVLILLLLSIGGNVWQISVRRNDKIRADLNEANNKAATAGHLALAKSHEDMARKVDSIRVRERDSTKVVVRALKDETKAYKKTIAVLRPLVAARIDSVPQLRDFVAAQDNTILKQDSTITSLEIANTNEINRAAEIQESNQAQINELVSATNGLQESLVFEQSESRKYKKKADKRWGVGVNAGYGVMSTGGEVRTGPTIQVGVQWRLFRF